MSVSVELHELVDDLLSDEPRRALAAYRRLVDDQLPWLERRAVLSARKSRYSWAGIGRLLGRTRQAVQQKFDRAFSADELSPAPQRLFPEAELGRYYDLLRADLARDRFVDEAGDDGSLVPW